MYESNGPEATRFRLSALKYAANGPEATRADSHKASRSKANRDGDSSYMAIRSPTLQAIGARYVRNVYNPAL